MQGVEGGMVGGCRGRVAPALPPGHINSLRDREDHGPGASAPRSDHSAIPLGAARTRPRSVSPLRRCRQVLYAQLPSCDQFAVVFPFDFDEPNLLHPTSVDWRAGRPHTPGPMRTEEVGGVRHADHGHAARSLVGSDCGPVTTDGLYDRGPHATMDNAIRLLMSFIDIDISNDSRRCQLVDPESQRAVPAWLRVHPMPLFGCLLQW